MDEYDHSDNPSHFDKNYLAYPLSHIGKHHLDSGNMIIMPPSALNHLASLPVSYPMHFRLQNTITGHHSHSGVLEFTAQEGFVLLPTSMMNNMQLESGDLVNIKNATLPKGTYIKIQPHATKFITLSDHKSLLEKAFRDFACLTTGDVVVINHGEEKYVVNILETKPSPAISLFDTDCEVEFAPPLDYKQPEKKPVADFKGKRTSDENKSTPGSRDDVDIMMKEYKPFSGIGRRLDGMQVPETDHQSVKKSKRNESSMPTDHDGKPMEKKPQSSTVEEKVNGEHEGFKAFTGKSFRLGG
ncbi:ubiquitin fusion degradation protein 1 homolog [Cynara cardunculus var. scolymus]|uniref:Ubiquitin fusion degradation protein UFD1 n=1 Tax=Cynara cardunculus var. scolymus TaxID=59895 RepID=A0A103YIR1_CYNCS|nr:ubiquitin fusion degradation protein 1 homolog [Cynara cardunculus var. scolymus]KVI09859.1 hypothetical protein Ccrd_011742 [Cynara cardunculus var. scolymus]